MASDKDKKKIVTDEDVAKLLDELLADAAPPDTQHKDKSREIYEVEIIAAEDVVIGGSSDVWSAQDAAAQEQENDRSEEHGDEEESLETNDLEEDFYVEDEDYDPKKEEARRKGAEARARAGEATHRAVERATIFYHAVQKLLWPLALLLGRDVEVRTRRLQAIWANMGFIAALVTGLVMLVYIYVAIMLSGQHGYKQQVHDMVLQMTGHEFIIDGDVDFELFPTIRFTVEGAHLKNLEGAHDQDMLSVKSIELRPSLLWLVLNTVKVREIVLHDPAIRLENFIGQQPNWKWYGRSSGDNADNTAPGKDKAAQDFEKALGDYLSGASITLLNATFVYTSGAVDDPVERRILLDSAYFHAGSLQGPFRASGVFTSETLGMPLDYELRIDKLTDNIPKVAFNINLGTSAISMEGRVQGAEGSRSIRGKLKSTVAKASQIRGVELPRLVTDIFRENTSLIGGDFVISQEKAALQNVEVNSAYAKGKMNIGISFGAVNTLDLAMQGEALDLDMLTGVVGSRDKTAANEEGADTESTHATGDLFTNLTLPRDIKVHLDTSIKALTYKKQKLEDVRADVEMSRSSIILHEVSLKNLPGGTVMQALSQPDGQGNFVGDVKLQSDNLYEFLTWLGKEPTSVPPEIFKPVEFESRATMSAENVLLKDSSLQMGGMHVQGTVSLQGRKALVVAAGLHVNLLDIDRMAAMAAIAQGQDAQGKAASQQMEIRSVRSIFDQLRKLDVIFERLDLALNADELRYNNQVMQNFSGKGAVGGGLSEFSDVTFDSIFGKVALSAQVDNRLLKPKVDISVEAEKVTLQDLKPLLGIVPADAKQQASSRWSEEIIDTSRLTSFEGEMHLKAGEFHHNNFTAKDMAMDIDILGDRLQIKEGHAKIFGSRMKMEGYIMTGDRPAISGAFAIANADVKEMLGNLFGFEALEGKINLTGGINMSGFTVTQWFSTLQGNLNFVSRGIKAKGFNLALLDQRVLGLQSIKEVKYWVPRILASGETDFNYIAGGAKIDQGVVSLKDIVMRSFPLKESTLETKISLPDWSLHLKSEMKVGARSLPVRLTIDSDIDQPTPYWEKERLEDMWEQQHYR